MAIVKKLNGCTPKFGKDCFLADNSAVIGNVVMGDNCSVWFGAVVRGDVHEIRIGNKVNIQDNATIHATYRKSPTHIGNNVSIAHNAVIHGCTIQDNVLIGMGAIVLDDAVVESNTNGEVERIVNAYAMYANWYTESENVEGAPGQK